MARVTKSSLGAVLLVNGPSKRSRWSAVQALGRKVHLEIYRMDLSRVTSKYIGETEKNLEQVFDAAEAASAILFVDEADALFGKRSAVKDGHNRYDKVLMASLRQRLARFHGLAILGTSLKDNRRKKKKTTRRTVNPHRR